MLDLPLFSNKFSFIDVYCFLAQKNTIKLANLER